MFLTRNLVTHVSYQEVSTDITTLRVMEGNAKVKWFSKGFHIPFRLAPGHHFSWILMI